MELVDADGRRWKVRSVRRNGRAGSLLNLLLPFGPPQSRIEHDLEPMEAASIEDVHDRICAAMKAEPEIYFHGDEREADFDPPLSVVRATSSVSELYELMQPDTFEPH